MQDFATRHGFEPIAADIARIKAALARFYDAVEKIDPPHDYYIQLYDGGAVRQAADDAAIFHGLGFAAALAIAEMPAHWSTRYRASVAYHLAPMMYEVVNS